MAKPSPIKIWFESEVLWPRTTSSMIRSVLLQFCTLLVFASVQTFNPFHPLTWMSSNLSVIITPSSWFYDLIAVSTVIGVGMLYGQQLTLYWWIPKNNLEAFLKLFQPQVLASGVAHFFAGGILMRSYLGLLGGKFNGLVTQNGLLNVPHVFLIFSGCFTSLAIWRDFHFGNSNVVNFPIIQQTGHAQLSRKLGHLVKKSTLKVALYLRWFYFFYAVLGYRLTTLLSEVSRTDLSTSSHFIFDDVWQHLEVFAQCLALNGLLAFSFRLLRTIIRINYTRRLVFDVSSSGDRSIGQAMNEPHDLLSHLAFYDFCLLSSESKLRRAECFTLSQPGGHPHNWNMLSKACMSKIASFCQKLNDAAPHGSQLHPTAAEPATPSISQTILYSNQGRPLSSQVRPKLGQATASSNNAAAPKESAIKRNDIGKRIEEYLSKTALYSYPMKILKAIKDKFSNNTLFSSPQDAAIRAVFAQSQIIIWAVEGLSNMVSASLTEDRYGVVQKDLAEIMSALFNLQKTIDKHKGVTITSRKNRFETRDLQLKQELRIALKSSIYKIVSSYGDHLDSVPLPGEWQKKVHNFRLFQEG